MDIVSGTMVDLFTLILIDMHSTLSLPRALQAKKVETLGRQTAFYVRSTSSLPLAVAFGRHLR